MEETDCGGNWVLFWWPGPCSVQFTSVAQSCPTVCNPMDCSTPGLPVHHQLLKFTQTHVHWVGDAIQPPHPLSQASKSVLRDSGREYRHVCTLDGEMSSSAVWGRKCVLLSPKSWLSVHWRWKEIQRQSLGVKRKTSFILCQAKREHSSLVPQEQCPHPWRTGTGLIVRAHSSGVGDKAQSRDGLHSSFFCKISKWLQLALGLVLSKVICLWPSFWNENATREWGRGKNARCRIEFTEWLESD